MCTHENFFNLPYGLAIQLFRTKDLLRISKKLSKKDKEHVVVPLAKDEINKSYKGKLKTYKKFYVKDKLSIDI